MEVVAPISAPMLQMVPIPAVQHLLEIDTAMQRYIIGQALSLTMDCEGKPICKSHLTSPKWIAHPTVNIKLLPLTLGVGGGYNLEPVHGAADWLNSMQQDRGIPQHRKFCVMTAVQQRCMQLDEGDQPVHEIASTPGPWYSTMAPVPPLTVKMPATLQITSFGDVHRDSLPVNRTPITCGIMDQVTYAWTIFKVTTSIALDCRGFDSLSLSFGM